MPLPGFRLNLYPAVIPYKGGLRASVMVIWGPMSRLHVDEPYVVLPGKLLRALRLGHWLDRPEPEPARVWVTDRVRTYQFYPFQEAADSTDVPYNRVQTDGSRPQYFEERKFSHEDLHAFSNRLIEAVRELDSPDYWAKLQAEFDDSDTEDMVLPELVCFRLMAAGIMTGRDLRAQTPASLLALRGIGEQELALIVDLLALYQLSLSD